MWAFQEGTHARLIVLPGSHEKYKGTKVEGVQVYRSVVHVYMSYSPGIIYFLFDLYHSVFREVMNSTSTRVPVPGTMVFTSASCRVQKTKSKGLVAFFF